MEGDTLEGLARDSRRLSHNGRIEIGLIGNKNVFSRERFAVVGISAVTVASMETAVAVTGTGTVAVMSPGIVAGKWSSHNNSYGNQADSAILFSLLLK